MTTRELLDRYCRRGTILTVLGGPLLAVSMVLAAARVEPYAFIVAVVCSLLFGSGLMSGFLGARCLACGTPLYQFGRRLGVRIDPSLRSCPYCSSPLDKDFGDPGA